MTADVGQLTIQDALEAAELPPVSSKVFERMDMGDLVGGRLKHLKQSGHHKVRHAMKQRNKKGGDLMLVSPEVSALPYSGQGDPVFVEEDESGAALILGGKVKKGIRVVKKSALKKARLEDQI